MCTYVAICLFLVIGSVYAGKQEFPSYIKPCKRTEDVKQCIMENIELCRPHMKKGIPKLTIPPLDPLELPKIGLESANLNLQCEDFSFAGLQGLKLNDVNFDFDKSMFDLDFVIPHAEIHSKYKIKGRILVLQLDGSGPLYLNTTNVHFIFKLKGEQVDKDGKSYINIISSDVKLVSVEDAFLQLHNLFGNNEELTKTTNAVFNENIPSLVDELRPLFERAVGDVFTNIMQTFFQKYSVDKLLI